MREDVCWFPSPPWLLQCRSWIHQFCLWTSRHAYPTPLWYRNLHVNYFWSGSNFHAASRNHFCDLKIQQLFNVLKRIFPDMLFNLFILKWLMNNNGINSWDCWDPDASIDTKIGQIDLTCFDVICFIYVSFDILCQMTHMTAKYDISRFWQSWCLKKCSDLSNCKGVTHYFW